MFSSTPVTFVTLIFLGLFSSILISYYLISYPTIFISIDSKLIVLPECFNCPYSTADFPEYAEYIPEVNSSEEYEGTVASLSSWAKELGIYIVGGSIPERSLDGKIYNTSTVFDSNGLLIAKHRKLHLFDIDIPGKMTFKESDSLSPGNEITLFDMKLQPNVDANEAGSTVRVGLGICYDIRFSEYAQSCAYNGAKLLIYPGAFNLVTGPAHWELLQKCRAVDNQVYVAGCSPARAPESDPGYKAWGHSTIVSPWGDVVGKCAAEASIVYGSLDFVRLEEIRNQIPITKQRRYDVYPHPHKLTQNKA